MLNLLTPHSLSSGLVVFKGSNSPGLCLVCYVRVVQRQRLCFFRHAVWFGSYNVQLLSAVPNSGKSLIDRISCFESLELHAQVEVGQERRLHGLLWGQEWP